jgi:exonuclease SbcC
MKILKLKFRNINSLAGDWEIDFTQPEFAENGLFAITGKTGSGKSSILDAISLALYGKTPRVDVTGSNNDVMTRGTSDCLAEIEFESAGKIRKASWKQERTRTGNLKPVQRTIANSENIIIADQIKACDGKIVEILGLTFEQFTKVILLAQGSFAAFLQTDKSDKGELLEQITGTGIYGEISRKVFERNRDEKEKLEQIIFQLGEIKILDDEQVKILENQITALEEQKSRMDHEWQVIITAQNRLRELSGLQKQINDAKEKLPELAERELNAKNALQHAENDLNLFRAEQEKSTPLLVKVRELDTRIAEKDNALNPALKAIRQAEEEKDALSGNLEKQKIDLQKMQNDVKQKTEWKTNHAKYESLVGSCSAIESRNLQLQKLLNDLNVKRTDAGKAAKNLAGITATCQKAERNFHEKHQSLEEKLQELEDRKKKSADLLNRKELTALQSEKENIIHFGNNLKALIEQLGNIISNKQEIESCEKLISENTQQEKNLSEKIMRNKDILENLKKQMDLLRENITFAKTIQSLEERRRNLEDGRECPLCGSKIHPFAAGNMPVASEKEKQLQALSRQLDDIEKAAKADEQALAKATGSRENAEKNKKAAEGNLSENRRKNRQLLPEIQVLKDEISEDAACLERLEDLRKEKLIEWQQVDGIIKNAVQIEIEIKKLRDEIIPQHQRAEKLAETAKNESATEKKLMEKIRENAENMAGQAKIQYEKENAAFLAELAEYGAENMEELKNCRDLWIKNEESIQKLSRQQIELQGNIRTTESLIETKKKQLDDKNTEKEQMVAAKNNLAASRKTLFGDKKADEEENQLKKRVSHAETAKNAAGKALNEANTELAKTNVIIREAEKQFLARQADNITGKTPEDLQAEHDEKKLQSDEILQKIGASKQILEANQERFEKNRKKLTEKEAQQRISEKWKRLDILIGSSDGKKYRNFAQALTFENLIVLANKQMKKMSERYILKRVGDLTNPFELSVIDKFQNCDERTAQNLSGGEKFIVSLALALALANMAGQNMKIDTMFIDEGFGTLDSDYLNVALTALSNLQSEGKLIGVISHLVELKERIATHIEVTSKGDGHSKLEIIR